MKRILYFESQTPLEGLAEASFQLTPKVSTPVPKRLYLDITDTQKLFGGESATLSLAQNLATSFSPDFNEVLTERPEWAMAMAVDHRILLPPSQSQKFLFQLPLERLVYCGNPTEIPKEEGERGQLVAFMRRVGMHLIREFAELSTLAILRRFGKLGSVLHEWVWGKRECVLPPFSPNEPIQEAVDAEEVCSLDQLLFLLEQVLSRVESRLLGRKRLAKEISLSFHVDSGSHFTETLKLSEPLYQHQLILKLLAEFLRNLTWDSPLLSLELKVQDTVPYSPGQLSLFDDFENKFSDLSQFVERLRARYGDNNAGLFTPHDSHLPEDSWKLTWPPTEKKVFYPTPRRPAFLFTPPKPIPPPTQWKLRASENIFAEWWNSPKDRRYFLAEPKTGERLWIFFDCLKKQWFVHGTFD